MKTFTALSLAALVFASLSGCAQDSMMMRQGFMQGAAGMKGGMDMKMLDTNNDAMISKEEFMKHHESMYDKMKKDGNGMVSVKGMQMMMHDMIKQK